MGDGGGLGRGRGCTDIVSWLLNSIVTVTGTFSAMIGDLLYVLG